MWIIEKKIPSWSSKRIIIKKQKQQQQKTEHGTMDWLKIVKGV